MSCSNCLARVHNFFSFEDSIPPYGKVQNATERAGNYCLRTARVQVGLLLIKEEGHLTCARLMKKVGAVALLILLIPVILVGAALRGIGALLPHTTYKHRTDMDGIIQKKYTDPVKIELCYELARSLKKVCIQEGFVRTDKPKIPRFLLVAGNALGALRNKGMIPWDDDIDTVVFKEDVPAFRKLQAAFEAEDLIFEEVKGYKFRLAFTKEKLAEFAQKFHAEKVSQGLAEDSDPVKKITKDQAPDVDAFIWGRMSDDCYANTSSNARAMWPRHYFTPAEMAGGARLYQFGPKKTGLKLPMLQREHAETYLKRLYSNDCLTHGMETHEHLYVRGKRVQVLKKDAYRFLITNHKPGEGVTLEWRNAPAQAHPAADEDGDASDVDSELEDASEVAAG